MGIYIFILSIGLSLLIVQVYFNKKHRDRNRAILEETKSSLSYLKDIFSIRREGHSDSNSQVFKKLKKIESSLKKW